jgi:hypothetical protein
VEAARVIDLMSANGGYIAAPAQYIQSDVPLANILALINTVQRYADND